LNSVPPTYSRLPSFTPIAGTFDRPGETLDSAPS
jgi:hypothetical protein